MRAFVFARRNWKEVLRDPICLAFGLGFPVVLLLLLSLLQRNIPVQMFEIDQLAPGMTVFGLSFLSLFSAQVIARDRASAFLMRLFCSPMQPNDFILGYTLPLLPMALGQFMVCYLAAWTLGLTMRLQVLLAMLAALPTAVIFIAMGLLCGTLFSERQVGGLCGALLTNLSAWLSGIWFPVELAGEAFAQVANCLPFVHAVALGRAALSGNYAAMAPELVWVGGYAVGLMALAVLVFHRKMRQK